MTEVLNPDAQRFAIGFFAGSVTMWAAMCFLIWLTLRKVDES